MSKQDRLSIVPLELRELNELVVKWHRHHKKVQGHRFSIGVVNELGELVGGCSVGRPVARMTNSKEVLEVTRLVTNGTPNACSALYSAACRVGREMGYKRIQTFILDVESGTSLRGAGWQKDDWNSGGGSWTRKDRQRREDQPQSPKGRWSRRLAKHLEGEGRV